MYVACLRCAASIQTSVYFEHITCMSSLYLLIKFLPVCPMYILQLTFIAFHSTYFAFIPICLYLVFYIGGVSVLYKGHTESHEQQCFVK
jgi:hypothetical protein